jgi:hypothetical protein
MFPYTMILVQDRAEELRAYAANERLVRVARASSDRPNRIVRAMSAVKTAFTTPATESSMSFLPTLTDYPTRG